MDRRFDVELFKAIGEPTRAKLLACLIKCNRPCSVSEVAKCCDVDFSVVARHLAILTQAGALESNKQGRTVWHTAQSDDLSKRLRSLADAIDEWRPDDSQSQPNRGGCCGDA